MLDLYKKIKAENFNNIYSPHSNAHYYNDKNLTHYYYDSNLFAPMFSPKIVQLTQPFLMVVDPETSHSITPVNEIIHQRTGDSHFRLIAYPNGTYALLSAIGRENRPGGNVVIPDGKYHFIICYIEEYKGLELKIGCKPHFYLNNKQKDHVALAGELTFRRNDNVAIIEEINDHSGSYNTKSFGDKVLLEAKKTMIIRIIPAVGLPLHKFKFYCDKVEKPLKRQHSLHEFNISKISRSKESIHC